MRCWKRSSFQFGHARQPLRIGMVRGKRTPLRLGDGDSIFAAIYYKRSHLARGRRSARSRRDLPIALPERFQLRVLATCTFAGAHRDAPWEIFVSKKKHPLAPQFSVISWLLENRTVFEFENYNDKLSAHTPLWRVPLTRTLVFM